MAKIKYIPPGAKQQQAQPKPQPQEGQPEQLKHMAKGGGGLAGVRLQPEMFTPRWHKFARLGYWQDPRRVARYKAMMDALPPGVDAPDWLPKDAITQAYQRMQERNGDRPWWQWEPLDTYDPLHWQLGELPAPPKGAMWPREQQVADAADAAQAEVDWNNLPKWQQTMAQLQANPYLGGVVSGGVQGALFGGLAGLVTAGPLGALSGAAMGGVVGGAFGAAFGAGATAATLPENIEGVRQSFGDTAAELVQKFGEGALAALNVPAEETERLIGTLVQLPEVAGEAYITARTKGGDVAMREFWQALKAAHAAGSLTYEAATGGGQLTALSNVPAAIEWVWRKVTGDNPEMIKFAKPGTAWVLGQAEPQPQDVAGYALLAQARRMILQGAPSEQVLQTLAAQYGPEALDWKPSKQVVEAMRARYGSNFSATFGDMVLQAMADPLNVAEVVERKGIEHYARRTGNPALEAVARLAENEGAIGTLKTYGEFLRTGEASALIVAAGGAPKTAETMLPWERKLAGVDESGVIRELKPGMAEPVKKGAGEILTNVINPAGWVQALRQLTPRARATLLLEMAHENIGALFEAAGGNPDEMVRMVQAWIELSPRQAGEVASLLGYPEAQTVRQGLAEFKPTLDEFAGRWEMGAERRAILRNMAALLDEEPARVLEAMEKPQDAAALIERMRSAAQGSESDAAKAVLAGIEGGDLTAETLGEMAQFFDENPWHPEQFRAQLHNAMLDHLAQWSIEAYGVKPSSKFVRFFQGLKGVQSLLLLGVNPGYVVNNVLDNTRTRIADGVFGFVRGRDIDAFFREWGEPARLRQGVGAADLGTASMEGADAILRDAARADDWVQAFQDWARGVGKKAPFTRLGAAAEASASKKTMFYAIRQMWGRLWRRGVGLPEMPAELESALREINPSLPDAVYGALEQARNHEHVNAILEGTSAAAARWHLESYIDDVARDIGADAGDVREALMQSGALDALHAALDAGMQPDEAFAHVERQVQDYLDARLRRDLERRAAEAGAMVRAEGFPAALNLYVDMQMKLEEQWTRHFAEWEQVYRASEENPKLGRALKGEQSSRARREWARHQAWERATYAGIFEALGFEGEGVLRFERALMDLHETWGRFFDEKARLIQQYFDGKKKWGEVQQELLDLYDEANTRRRAKTQEMHEAFLRAWEEAGNGNVDAVRAWLNGLDVADETRARLMAAFRERMAGVPASEWKTQAPELDAVWDEIAQAGDEGMWSKFLQLAYLPAIAEQIKAAMDGARRAFGDGDEAAGGEVPPPEPGPQAPEAKPAEKAPTEAQGAPQGVEKQPQVPEAKPAEKAPTEAQGAPQEGETKPPDGMTAEEAAQVEPLPSARKVAARYGMWSNPGDDARVLEIVNDYQRVHDGDLFARLDDVDAFTAEGAMAWYKRNDETVRNVIYGPRDALNEALGNPLVAAFLDDMIVYIAKRMQDTLPPSQEAVVVIETEEGGYRASQNPQWYKDLYAEYKARGKSLNRKAVESALQRIIDDHGRDVIRSNEETIAEIKALIGYELMYGSGDMPPYPYLLLLTGDVAGAARALWDWMLSDFGPEMTDDVLVALTGSMDNAKRLLDYREPVPETARVSDDATDAGHAQRMIADREAAIGFVDDAPRAIDNLVPRLPEPAEPVGLLPAPAEPMPSPAPEPSPAPAVEPVPEPAPEPSPVAKQSVYDFNRYDERKKALMELFGMDEQAADDELILLDALAETTAQRLGSDVHESMWEWLTLEYSPISSDEPTARGAYISRSQPIIMAYEHADADTWLHESAHFWWDVAATEDVRRQVYAAMWGTGRLADELGRYGKTIDFPDDVKTQAAEYFAERYVQWREHGTAPSAKLRKAFERFRAFLRGVFERLRARFGANVQPGEAQGDVIMDRVFRSMFAKQWWEMRPDEFLALARDDPRVQDAARLAGVGEDAGMDEIYREAMAGTLQSKAIAVPEDVMRDALEWAKQRDAAKVAEEGTAEAVESIAQEPAPGEAVRAEQAAATAPRGKAAAIAGAEAQKDGKGGRIIRGIARRAAQLFEAWGPAVQEAAARDGFHAKAVVGDGSSGILPLVIETHDAGDTRLLTMTHYLPVDESTGGDLIMDNEMVFQIWEDGTLFPVQFGYRSPFGGEMRIQYGQTQFSKMMRLMAENLLQYGFEDRARLYFPDEGYMRLSNEDMQAVQRGELTEGDTLRMRAAGHNIPDWFELRRGDDGVMRWYKAAGQAVTEAASAPAAAYTEPAPRAFMDAVRERLGSGAMSRGDFEQMAQDYGFNLDDDAQVRMAYDLLEGALNLQVREVRDSLTDARPGERILKMAELEGQMVRARRGLGKMAMQQFSTPLPIAEAAGLLADVRPDDVVFEPTAGTGNLVEMFAGRRDVQVYVNELDAGRRDVLKLLGYAPDALDLMKPEWVLDEDGRIRPPAGTVVITNPPWGAYSTGKYGRAVNVPVKLNDWSQRFAYLTLERLPEDGRFVGIMPTNWLYTVDRRTREMRVKPSEFYQWLRENHTIRAVIESPPGAYESRGTGVGSLLVVIDKGKKPVPTEVVAWGENRPKTWEEYARIIDSSLEFMRRGEKVERAQRAYSDAVEKYQTPTETTRIQDAPEESELRDPVLLRKEQQEGEQAKATATTETQPKGRPEAPQPEGKPEAPQKRPGGNVGRAQAPAGVGGEQSAGSPEGGAAGDVRGGEPGSIPARERYAGGGETAGGRGNAPGRGKGRKGAPETEVVAEEAGRLSDRVRRRMERLPAEVRSRFEAHRRAIASSGGFDLYVPRSPVAPEDFRTHPTPLVESKSLAGIEPPRLEPEYQPHEAVMNALRRGAISVEANLDAIWAAVQQNDKHNMGVLIADDVGVGKSRTVAGFVLDRVMRGKKRILVITKGWDNVTNLVHTEIPGVWGGEVDARGRWVKVPDVGEYPAEVTIVSGRTFPEAKKGEGRLPVSDRPQVFVIPNHEFAAFSMELRRWAPDVLVVDEAHLFANVESAKYGPGWQALHKDMLGRNGDFLYLTATPGTDVSELGYLYGLRVWSVDGFGDWVKMLTGELSPDEVVRRREEIQKIEQWIDHYNDVLMNLQLEDDGHKVAGMPWLRVDQVSYNAQRGKDWEVRTTGSAKLSLGFMGYEDALFVIHSLIPQANEFRDALFRGDNNTVRNMFYMAAEAYRKNRPEAAMQELGIRGDLSDFIGEKGKRKWGKRSKLGGYQYTLTPAHTEQVMRELKAGGWYMSRDISRIGVTYDIRQVPLTDEDIAAFNKRVALYRDIQQAFDEFGPYNEGPKKMQATFGLNGYFQGDAKRALFHMRLQGMMDEIDSALSRGQKVVVSLISTGAVEEGGNFLRSAIDMINTQEVRDLGDGVYSDPTEIPEALLRRAELLERLQELGDMPSPIDVLKERYGDKVGFVTGDVGKREREQVRRLFQNDALDIVVISQAGKTGINLHDVTGRQVHMIVADYEWSATTFKQELGRVDRTGQETSPEITILHTGAGAEKKFITTIANRMRGLGATSKGGSETTGSVLGEYEFGGVIDRMAIKRLWDEHPEIREAFIDKYFDDPTVAGVKRVALDGTTEDLKKFMLGLQTMPYEEGVRVMDLLDEIRQKVIAENEEALAEDAEARTMAASGSITRETRLNDDIQFFEVKNKQGQRFGILTGVLTPWMKRIKGAMLGQYFDPDKARRGAWMKWTRFYDEESGAYVSGLRVPEKRMAIIRKAFGALQAHTRESALSDLRAGDKIAVRGAGNAEWELYMGRGGKREGRIVIRGAKMSQRKALMQHGAMYHTSGFWYVDEDALDGFLQRFPIDNDRGGDRVLYQKAPDPADGYVPPEMEKAAREQAPDGAAVIRLPVPMKFPAGDGTREFTAVGIAFWEGKFAAWVIDGMGYLGEFDTPRGKARLLGNDGRGHWVYVRDGVLERMADKGGIPVGPLQPGALDNLAGVVHDSQVLDEGWANYVRPAFDALRKRVREDGGARGKGLPDWAQRLNAEQQAQLRAWGGQVRQAMAQGKVTANNYGRAKRDMALLNYGRRYGVDDFANIVWPYQFWYTRSAINWMLRAVERPAWLANYARWQRFLKRKEEQFPSRLAGKVRIPAPWLPKWAGGGVWVDPMSKVFPFGEFMRPMDNAMQGMTMTRRNAEWAIEQMVRDGQVSRADAAEALRTHKGPVWEQAMAQARLLAQQRGDPLGFLGLLTSPALYLTIPAALMSGKAEKIQPLPLTRTLQAYSTALGFDARKFDLEGVLRRKYGLSEFGEWGNYYVDRQLANMAADGEITADEARAAMVQRRGPVYDEAMRRVQVEMMLRTPGAAPVYAARRAALGEAQASDVVAAILFGYLPAGIFPTGELKLRGLQKEYEAAREAYNNGDEQAFKKFFSEHPEYEARMMLRLWDKPEERLRQFLIDTVWERYAALPKVRREEAAQAFGPMFGDAFLDSETRNYDAIPTEALQAWAQFLGAGDIGGSGEDIGGEGAGSIGGNGGWVRAGEAAPDAVVQVVQAYETLKERNFPYIDQMMQVYFDRDAKAGKPMPQIIQDYLRWRYTYLAEHPEALPYLVGDKGTLAGLPQEIQAGVYQFRALREQMFPNWRALQDAYFGLDEAARRAFLTQNPALRDYWQWKREYAAANPKLAPYIMGEDSLSKAILGSGGYRGQGSSGGGSIGGNGGNIGGNGGEGYKGPPVLTRAEMRAFSPALVRQLYGYFYAGHKLGTGAQRELQRVLDMSGRDMRLGEYLEQIVKPSFRP